MSVLHPRLNAHATDPKGNPRGYAAAYGIQWSVDSLRVGAPVYHHIRALDDAGIDALVARIAADCETIGDVPYWLNRVLFPEITD